MGCLEEEMPPECRKFVDNTHTFVDDSNKLIFGLPFHKLWRTKTWKSLVQANKSMLDYTSNLVNQKIEEIARQDRESSDEVQAELGTDFLTYMVHTGTLNVQEIAVSAIDLLNGGVDTVCQ